MKYTIDILLYNSFIELPGSSQTIGETKESFNFSIFSLPRAGQAERKEHATSGVASEDLKKFKGNQKKTASLCEIVSHEKHFCYFALEQLNLRNMFPAYKLRKMQNFLGFVSAMPGSQNKKFYYVKEHKKKSYVQKAHKLLVTLHTKSCWQAGLAG